MTNVIPYGRHDICEADIQAVVDCLRSGALTQGPKVAEFVLVLQMIGDVVAHHGNSEHDAEVLALRLIPVPRQPEQLRLRMRR